MGIELKSNRKIYIMLLAITLSIILLLFAIGLIVDYNEFVESYVELIVFGAIFLIFLVILLILIFKPRPKFIFEENKIIIIKNKVKIEIKITDIQSMEYFAFKWQYIFLVFLGAIENGATKIHIKLKNNEKIELGYIYLKDAEKVKEIYPNLMKIC